MDPDACPVARVILFRVAVRTGVKPTLVASQSVRVPASPLIEIVQVRPGFDAADNEIVKRAGCGGPVITADIPLAAEVMVNGIHALRPRVAGSNPKFPQCSPGQGVHFSLEPPADRPLSHQPGVRESGVPPEPERSLRRYALEYTSVTGGQGMLVHRPGHA